MAEITWEKSEAGQRTRTRTISPKRLKFMLASVLLLGTMGFMIYSGTANGGKFFITLNDMLSRPELVGQSIKVTGAVVGSTIHFDSNTNTITFTVANVSDDMGVIEKEGGLGQALHLAVTDPTTKRVNVVIKNQAMPDLLQNEAQAILTGTLGTDGVFYADELNLKCPSKYQGELPKQSS